MISASGLSARMILRAASRCPGDAASILLSTIDVGELDLLDQQIDQRALVALASDLAAIAAGNPVDE